MRNLLLNEKWFNINRGIYIGESGSYESYTDNKGELFRSLQRSFGRCIGKMYIDIEDGGAIEVGYVFNKKLKYTDCNEYYIQETWVELFESERVENHTLYIFW